MICEILHVMSMIHRKAKVMHLYLANLLYGIVIMESSSAAYHIDNLAVALMSMKVPVDAPGRKCRIHDLHLIVHIITGIEFYPFHP